MVLYALLIIIDNRIPDSAVDNTVVSEAQSQQRRLSQDLTIHSCTSLSS